MSNVPQRGGSYTLKNGKLFCAEEPTKPAPVKPRHSRASKDEDAPAATVEQPKERK